MNLNLLKSESFSVNKRKRDDSESEGKEVEQSEKSQKKSDLVAFSSLSDSELKPICFSDQLVIYLCQICNLLGACLEPLDIISQLFVSGLLAVVLIIIVFTIYI